MMVPRVTLILSLVVALGGIAAVLLVHIPRGGQVVVHRSQPTVTAADESGEVNEVDVPPSVKSPEAPSIPSSKPRSTRPASKSRRAQKMYPPGWKAPVSPPRSGKQQTGTRGFSAVSVVSVAPSSSISFRQDVSEVAPAQNVPPANEGSQLQPKPLEPSPPPETAVARVAAIRPPSLITGTSPEYPEGAYHLIIDRSSLLPNLRIGAAEGRVVLRLFVLVTGRVGRVTIAVSSGFETLDQATVRAAELWQFVPATQEGLPIEAWALIPVRFVLK